MGVFDLFRRRAPGGPGTMRARLEGAMARRRLRGWQPPLENINSLVASGGPRLLARSRELVVTNGYATNACEAFAANLVGDGIKPSSLIEDADLRDQVQRLWFAWSDEADADGLTDFYGLQAMAAREMFVAGECFIRLRPRRAEDGLLVPLQLQLLQSEMLPFEKTETAANGNRIRCGIEFDRLGRRVAYHFRRRHPGDSTDQGAAIPETVRVPAGDVLHGGVRRIHVEADVAVSQRSAMPKRDPFKYFHSSPEIIRLAVMMYVRFALSLRNVEDLLHERGIDVSHETIRFWWNRFGPMFASEIRRRRAERMRTGPQWQWHVDAVFVKVNGERHYMWRAVDHEGEVLEAVVTKRRNKRAALKFLRKLMRRYGQPEVLVTDRFPSYLAAPREIGAAGLQRAGRWLNNRAENSHLPFRRRERAMQRFRRMRSLQKFAAVHSSVCNHFNQERHLYSRQNFKLIRSAALDEWRQLCST